MVSSPIDKLRTIIRAFYHVPWCVPAWGWPELAITAKAVVMGRIDVGPHTETLIREMQEQLHIEYVLPFNRGRTAITVALKALGLPSRTEILIPSYVCHTVAEAVVDAGMKPVFADVESDGHLSVSSIRRVITPSTGCVIVPHLYGNVAPVAEIEAFLSAKGIPLIDDAAQSFGARAAGKPIGTFGVCGIVACGPGKNLAGAAGGLLVTNSREMYEAARSVAVGREPARLVLVRTINFWVWRRMRKYTLPVSIIINRLFGAAGRPELHTAACISDLDAGIMRVQIKRLDESIRARRYNASKLVPAVSPIIERVLTDLSDGGTVTKLVVVLRNNEISLPDVIDLMSRAGIECQGGYVGCHADYGVDSELLNTAELASRVLCIPVERQYRRMARMNAHILAFAGAHGHAGPDMKDEDKAAAR